mmetsp:Transcript_21608/g.51057  ORF Transcript_21608/g.51057 Transcript_21608/m.51057 type:complete len:83 (-) Transcript_21608:300-548(-)
MIVEDKGRTKGEDLSKGRKQNAKQSNLTTAISTEDLENWNTPAAANRIQTSLGSLFITQSCSNLCRGCPFHFISFHLNFRTD